MQQGSEIAPMYVKISKNHCCSDFSRHLLLAIRLFVIGQRTFDENDGCFVVVLLLDHGIILHCQFSRVLDRRDGGVSFLKRRGTSEEEDYQIRR